MIPDAETAKLDPFFAHPTLSLDLHRLAIRSPKQPYSRDPRHIAQEGRGLPPPDRHRRHVVLRPRGRVLRLRRRPLRSLEAERGAIYYLDCDEGAWNTGSEECPNLGYKTRHKEGYFPVPPTDTLANLRTEMMLALQASAASRSRSATTRSPPAVSARSA